MKCRYARMAIFHADQVDWVVKDQSREDYIRATLAKNAEFRHGKTTLYYSPRLITEQLIAGVIERRATRTVKSGPWENEKSQVETYNTANFAIKLSEGQEAALEQAAGVYKGKAVLVFRSLGEHFNAQPHNWHIDFRQIGSEGNLEEYLSRHSGAIKKISLIFERPNADFGAHRALHDDLKESLSRIRASRLKKDYVSDEAQLMPDDRVRNEMNYANSGNGDLKISNKDDSGNATSFRSKQSEHSAQVEDNRKVDEMEKDDEIRDVATNMLGGVEAAYREPKD